MEHPSRFLAVAAIVCCLLAACENPPEPTPDDGDDSDSASADFTLPVSNENGTELDGDEEVVVIWTVTSGSPDYYYAWGGGTIDDGRAVIDLPDETPPPEALNAYSLGVAMVVVVPENTLGEGNLGHWSNVREHILAMSDRHALIFRDEGSELPQWTRRFPVGQIRCGQGVESDEGMGNFDTFEPVDCGSVEVRFADEYDVVNWT